MSWVKTIYSIEINTPWKSFGFGDRAKRGVKTAGCKALSKMVLALTALLWRLHWLTRRLLVNSQQSINRMSASINQVSTSINLLTTRMKQVSNSISRISGLTQGPPLATAFSGGALIAIYVGFGLATGRLQLPPFFGITTGPKKVEEYSEETKVSYQMICSKWFAKNDLLKIICC